jgi:hypothetical protein
MVSSMSTSYLPLKPFLDSIKLPLNFLNENNEVEEIAQLIIIFSEHVKLFCSKWNGKWRSEVWSLQTGNVPQNVLVNRVMQKRRFYANMTQYCREFVRRDNAIYPKSSWEQMREEQKNWNWVTHPQGPPRKEFDEYTNIIVWIVQTFYDPLQEGEEGFEFMLRFKKAVSILSSTKEPHKPIHWWAKKMVEIAIEYDPDKYLQTHTIDEQAMIMLEQIEEEKSERDRTQDSEITSHIQENFTPDEIDFLYRKGHALILFEKLWSGEAFERDAIEPPKNSWDHEMRFVDTRQRECFNILCREWSKMQRDNMSLYERTDHKREGKEGLEAHPVIQALFVFFAMSLDYDFLLDEENNQWPYKKWRDEHVFKMKPNFKLSKKSIEQLMSYIYQEGHDHNTVSAQGRINQFIKKYPNIGRLLKYHEYEKHYLT